MVDGFPGILMGRPLHSRFTDTSPQTAPKSLLPTIPEDAPQSDLAPRLFRKARSRTLSTPGERSGIGSPDARDMVVGRRVRSNPHYVPIA